MPPPPLGATVPPNNPTNQSHPGEELGFPREGRQKCHHTGRGRSNISHAVALRGLRENCIGLKFFLEGEGEKQKTDDGELIVISLYLIIFV